METDVTNLMTQLKF